MLTLYATQLTDLETELAKLSELLEQKKQMAKALKATERKATKLIDGLKGLINELPGDAIANLRDSVVSLFPSPQLPMTDDSSNDSPILTPGREVTWTGSDGKVRGGKVEEVTSEGAVIDQGHTYKPWVEKEFLTPATEPLTGGGKPPEELPDLGEKPTDSTFQGQPEKAASDIPIASSPDQLENAFSQVPRSDVPLTDATGTSELKTEEQPEAGNAITPAEAKGETPATAINEFCSFVYLNPTVGYIRSNRGQMAGEIMSAYVGCSSQKLASYWAELITLWGGRTEIRKAERLAEVAKYEIKIWDLSQKRINFLAEHHTDPSSPVPSFPSEFSKKPQNKSEENAEISSAGNGETTSPTNSNSIADESNEKPENGNLETQESKFYFTPARDYNALMPEFYCYLVEGNKYLGKVTEALSLDPAHQGRWRHDALKGSEWQTVSFASQESAAENLLKRKQYAENIHQKVNNDVRKMYGFDEIEKAETATEDALKKDAIERIDGYMQQLGWSKRQTKEFSIARFGIDHRSKMDLIQLLELAEAMQEQLKQQPA